MTIFSRAGSSEAVIPKGVGALCGIQVVSTLSYSVLYSTLVLYMTGKLGFSAREANHITGVFVAFNYALHLLGGYWGGRILSFRMLFCLGMLAQVAGCLLVAMNLGDIGLYGGLGAFLAGCGLNVTCINCLLTRFFEPGDSRRETAFFWNYAAMNAGFFAGFSLSGYFQMLQDYQSLFVLASLGNLAALMLCLRAWPHLADRDTLFSQKTLSAKRRSRFFGVLAVFALPPLLAFMLHHAEFANRLVLITGGVMAAIALLIARQQPEGVVRGRMQSFVVLMLVSTVFWMLFQTAPMGLTQFIEHNVARTVNGFTLPTQWFQNINTLTIVIGGPLMSVLLTRLRARGIEVSIPVQFALALLCIGFAFMLLPCGIARASNAGLVAPQWVVASFVLQSMGELLLSPVGYAMVGRLVPQSLQGVMMGMWMLTVGVGSTLASFTSNSMSAGGEGASPLLTNALFAEVFLKLGLLAVAAALFLWLLVPVLKRWMAESGEEPAAMNAATLAESRECCIEQTA